MKTPISGFQVSYAFVCVFLLLLPHAPSLEQFRSFFQHWKGNGMIHLSCHCHTLLNHFISTICFLHVSHTSYYSLVRKSYNHYHFFFNLCPLFKIGTDEILNDKCDLDGAGGSDGDRDSGLAGRSTLSLDPG